MNITIDQLTEILKENAIDDREFASMLNDLDNMKYRIKSAFEEKMDELSDVSVSDMEKAISNAYDDVVKVIDEEVNEVLDTFRILSRDVTESFTNITDETSNLAINNEIYSNLNVG